MSDYDTMSFDDLVLELVDELLPEEMSSVRSKTPRYEEIESALRKVVIQAERRRILDASLFQFGMGDGTYMMIRTSVVDPKEGEHDH